MFGRGAQTTAAAWRMRSKASRAPASWRRSRSATDTVTDSTPVSMGSAAAGAPAHQSVGDLQLAAAGAGGLQAQVAGEDRLGHAAVAGDVGAGPEDREEGAVQAGDPRQQPRRLRAGVAVGVHPVAVAPE